MKNLQKVRQFLTEHQYEGALLRTTHNFSWLTNGKYNYIVRNTEGGVADFLVLNDNVYLIVDETEKGRILEEELKEVNFEYEIVTCHWYDDKNTLIQTLIEGRNIVSDCPFGNLKVVDGELGQYRSVLSHEEIAVYKQLCQEGAQIVENVCKEIEVGMTEHDVEALVAKYCAEKDIRPHVILVSSDERLYNFRHPIPTNKRIEKQAMVVLCGERNGLVVDVTRLVHFGELSEELVRHGKQVAKISAEMMNATKPDVTAGDVIAVAIKEYEAAGYPTDWTKLHQGGLAGYKTREFLATPNHPAVVKANQTYAWNPMLPGVKCEDVFLVKNDGLEILTHTGDWVYEDVEIDGKVFPRPVVYVK